MINQHLLGGYTPSILNKMKCQAASSLFLPAFMYAFVLIPRIPPRNASMAVIVPTISSPYGSPRSPTMRNTKFRERARTFDLFRELNYKFFEIEVGVFLLLSQDKSIISSSFQFCHHSICICFLTISSNLHFK